MLLVPRVLHRSALAAAGEVVACPFQLRTQYHVLSLLLINTCWAGPLKGELQSEHVFWVGLMRPVCW